MSSRQKLEKMKFECIVEGIRILSKYEEFGNFVQAEHDEIFAGEAQVNLVDSVELQRLGWRRTDGQWRIST